MSDSNIIEHHNLPKVISDLIRKRILSGEFKQGQKITEVELSKLLGVSRTPIKISLTELSKEGLIELVPRKGSFIKVYSNVDVREIYEVRAVLEGLAVRYDILNITVERIGELRALIKEQEHMNKKYVAAKTLKKKVEYCSSIVNTDKQFHQLIIKSSRNGFLHNLFEMMNIISLTFFIDYRSPESRLARTTGKDLKMLEKTTEEHNRIVNALEQRDRKSAEKLLYNHIIAEKAYILEETRSERQEQRNHK